MDSQKESNTTHQESVVNVQKLPVIGQKESIKKKPN